MQDNKTKIISCALLLFSKYGYDAVGVQKIAESAGITKPTLYYYFGSKTGLFETIINFYITPFNEQLIQATQYIPNPAVYEKDLFPVLKKCVETYFEFAMKEPIFYKLLLSSLYSPESSETGQIVLAKLTAQYQLIENIFKIAGTVHGNLKNKEKQFGYTFIGMINMYITLSFLGHIQLKEFDAQHIVRQFMHGIFS
jgi:TetR/AcrR family transcriptional regulator